MRRAFTLIELLIVITVMLAVTAITVSVMAPALAGRRTREASSSWVVSPAADTWSNRACGRSIGDLAIDVHLHGAKNRAILTSRPGSTIFIEPDPAAPGSVITTFPQGDSGWLGLIHAGDLLKLNYQGYLYRISGQTDNAGHLVNMTWGYMNTEPGGPASSISRGSQK